MQHIIKTTIINRHDKKENWEKIPNFTPKLGEIVIYEDIDNGRFKIGDGKTAISELPFNGMEVDLYGDSIELEQEFYVNANSLGGVLAEDYALKSRTVSLNETEDDFKEEIVYTNANLLGGIYAADYALKAKTVAQEFSQQTETEFIPTTINSIQNTVIDLLYDEEMGIHFALMPENVQQVVSLNIPNYDIIVTNHILQERVLVVKLLQLNEGTLTLQKYQHTVNAVIHYY